MRVLALAVFLVACGRIHIDPLEGTPNGDGGAGGEDVLGSICADGGMCEVASSTTDFDDVPGANGWYYGYWIAGIDTDGTYRETDFVDFVYNAPVWEPPDAATTTPWCYLASWGGHPSAMPIPKLPIRRWVSTVSGLAEAVVEHKKADIGGDGTRAILFVDGVEVWSRAVAGDDGVGFVEPVPITLAVGTKVDLMLHYIGGEGVDTTTSSMIVRSR